MTNEMKAQIVVEYAKTLARYHTLIACRDKFGKDNEFGLFDLYNTDAARENGKLSGIQECLELLGYKIVLINDTVKIEEY